ncbi:hypothetical protein KAT80_03015 [Candidatus Pacearchaeota archaeon]|nr:hypothetical protein [Candidatus Pacearchaeota archaeon]
MNKLVIRYNEIRIKSLRGEIKRTGQIIYNSNLDSFHKPLAENDPKYNPCYDLKNKLIQLKSKLNSLEARS